MSFVELSVEDVKDNPFKLFNKDWALVTAGTDEQFNTMTVSWGGLGILWNKKICFCVIRPQRYTYSFVEKSETFTLSFFAEPYRQSLLFCGTKSGREVDKISQTGLKPVFNKDAIYFEEARLVFVCKKIYFQDITPNNFLLPEIDDNYPQKDYHRMYLGEIVQCLQKEDKEYFFI
ncbi:MAG: flavin reductase family protein [Candidatus Magnetoovum sp. WYHC-5]|nr:flavin reductase family protein [Candidatus Magnetoovum sp. WYHC-5]